MPNNQTEIDDELLAEYVEQNKTNHDLLKQFLNDSEFDVADNLLRLVEQIQSDDDPNTTRIATEEFMAELLSGLDEFMYNKAKKDYGRTSSIND